MKYLSPNEIRASLNGGFTKEQIDLIIKKTPSSEIETKKEANGKEYRTVKGHYIKKRLTIVFGFSYSFKIINEVHHQNSNEVVVKGRLVVRDKNGNKIIREQFGKSSTTMTTTKNSTNNRQTTKLSNIGNTFKAAATDSLKKCAAEFGICWDVYNYEAETLEVEHVEVKELTYEEQAEVKNINHFLSKVQTSEQLDTFIEDYELQRGDQTKNQMHYELFDNKRKSINNT